MKWGEFKEHIAQMDEKFTDKLEGWDIDDLEICEDTACLHEMAFEFRLRGETVQNHVAVDIEITVR